MNYRHQLYTDLETLQVQVGNMMEYLTRHGDDPLTVPMVRQIDEMVDAIAESSLSLESDVSYLRDEQ